MPELGPAIAATSSAANAGAPALPEHIGPAIAATSSAADAGTPISTAQPGPAFAATSSAADVTAPAQLGPAIAATSSAATAPTFQQASSDDSFAPADSHFVVPQAPAAAMWFAPNAFDAPATQWFAGLAPGDTFGIPAIQPSSFGHGGEAIGIATMETSSVFSTGSGDIWAGAYDGSFAVSELPFTSGGFDDTPIYTASSDTPWILAADFTGDGWFFV